MLLFFFYFCLFLFPFHLCFPPFWTWFVGWDIITRKVIIYPLKVHLPYITTDVVQGKKVKFLYHISPQRCARCRRPSRLAPRALHGRRVGASRGRRSATSRSGPRAASSSTTHLQCSSTNKLPHDSFLLLGSTIGNCSEPTNFRFQIWHPEMHCMWTFIAFPWVLWSMSRPCAYADLKCRQ